MIPNLPCRPEHRIISTRRWREDCVEAFQADLVNIPWNELRAPNDIDGKVKNWTNFFRGYGCMDKHFPLRKKRIRKNAHPWLDSTILGMMKRRDLVHKQARRSGDGDLWTLYRQLRNQVTTKLRKQRRNYFKQHLEENKGNPKRFWKTLKLALPGKKKVNSVTKLMIDNKEITEPNCK